MSAWFEGPDEKSWTPSESLQINRSASLPLKHINKRMARRLSPLTKMTIEMAWSQHEHAQPINYMVFSSRHGEIQTSTELIDLIWKDELLSPMKFSQSVHNTSAGQFSIFKKEKAPSTSIAAGENSFLTGLWVAGNYQKLNPTQSILYVFSDRNLPERYLNTQDKNLDSQSWVLAVILSPTGLTLSLIHI